ncbi:MAG: LacI family transcriptional regulator [Candidatus Lumbricidophila eiseniae]|uniref:LacI family transcriptional regulator n=1 Tax=Candidatus Lumbricidiphila eiseniae TaxID=1969409 RepID=A0A2A6FSL1_9MICO|nr:MAG: LacI family transcriptional regulator [Candidatus Lumbricidophila eiseniae]
MSSSGTAGRATTLSDVARRADVSIATASKALNGRFDVAPATRQRILAAAAELDFSPNPMAKGLSADRSGTVGILTGDLEGRFMIPILMGAENAFGTGRVNAFLCDARGDQIREQHHLKALLVRHVDGIIVVGPSTNPRPSLGQDIPVPVVYAYAPSEDPRDTSLTSDEVMGGRIQVEHLIACGRTRIAHISGDPTFAATQNRVQGIRQALDAAGLELVGPPLLSQWSEAWGRDAAAMLLERHPDIDAIACASDQIARGVLDTARDMGRRVPEDIAVIGYDNWDVLALNSRPQLSTIDANLEELGRLAAHQVFDAMDGTDTSAGSKNLPVRLVIRGSTIASR